MDVVVGRQGEIRRGPAYEPRYRLPAEHVEALQRHRSPIEWREPPRIIVPQIVASPTYQAIGTPVGGNGTVSPAWPAHAIGDIAILIVTTYHIGSGSAATLSTAAGFVAVTGAADVTAIGGDEHRVTTFWCRATSTSMSAPTVADNHQRANSVIITFRGCVATGNPYDVVSVATNSTSNTSVSVPGATTTVADTIVLAAIGGQNNVTAGSWANASLGSITERIDDYTGSVHLAAATGPLTAVGAYNATTATLSGNQPWAGVTIALKSANASNSSGNLLLLGVG